MEKYFIVKKDTKLYNVYSEYSAMTKKFNDVFNYFSEQQGITSSQYYQCATRLKVILNKEDMVKLGKYLVSGSDCDFKKTSPICKQWIALCKNMEVFTPRKPMMMDWIDCSSYKASSRIFMIGDVLYGSLDNKCSREFTLSDDYIELKASEFSKAIEDEKEKESK